MTRLPDFFIVGAPKCGTTSMYHYLRVHPDIFMPAVKEPHYFGRDLDVREQRRTREEYLALFEQGEGYKRAGESSVLYLYSSLAAREIRDFNPHARILIMLREPVSAMISWHGQLVSMGIENLYDFEVAVRAQDDRKLGQRLPRRGRLHRGLQYTSVFSYAEQVERYLNVFDRSQVCIALLDDVIRDVESAYRGVLEFLGVDPTFKPDFAVHNEKKWLRSPIMAGGLRRQSIVRKMFALFLKSRAKDWTERALSRVMPAPKRPSIRPEFLDELRAQCRPGVERLATLIKRDLSHWFTMDSKPAPKA